MPTGADTRALVNGPCRMRLAETALLAVQFVHVQRIEIAEQPGGEHQVRFGDRHGEPKLSPTLIRRRPCPETGPIAIP